MKRIVVLALCAAVGGCASSQDETAQELGNKPSMGIVVVAVPEAEAAGPPVGAPTQADTAEQVGEGVDVIGAPVMTVDLGGHRPSWWFDEAQWSEQRVTVCVEALGPEVLDARRASVRAAREALRELIGEEAAHGEIVLTAVKALPVPATAPGGNRYAGYVMITCVVEE